MKKIKVGIIGLGNCASSLIQGIHYYNEKGKDGLIHYELGGYTPSDIDVCLAFDIDKRKVGVDISQAIFSKPNCTTFFNPNIPKYNVLVSMGVVLDGIAEHMKSYEHDCTFVLADVKEPTKEEIIKSIKNSGAEMLVNFLPVGSQKASEFYAECAIESSVGFINCIPVFIASNNEWIEKFKAKGLPCIGDDIKAQIGATIVHRTLARLCEDRGIKILHTYQLNTAGNTDFLNMLNRSRLVSKKVSKTEAIQSNLNKPLEASDVHIGPSDYIEWLKDNKVCYCRIEGEQFGGTPVSIEVRLSVEDSPNSAACVIDTVRCMKIALNKKLCGNIESASAYFMKHPKVQMEDTKARNELEEFICG